MSARPLSLQRQSSGEASGRLGSGTTFANLQGHELTLDILNVTDLYVANIFTGGSVVPDVYYFGATGVAAGTSPAASVTQVIFPQPLAWGGAYAPFMAATAIWNNAGGSNTSEYQMPCSADGKTANNSTGPPIAGSNSLLGASSNAISHVNINPRSASILTCGTGTQSIGSMDLSIAVFPIAGMSVTYHWYVAGAPPDATPSSWGEITPGTGVATLVAPAAPDGYTTYPVTVSGGAFGAPDANNWQMSNTDPGFNHFPYSTFNILDSNYNPPAGRPTGLPTEPLGWLAPGAPLVASAFQPSFWLQDAIVTYQTVGSNVGQVQTYKASVRESMFAAQHNAGSNFSVATTGEGVDFEVYGRSSISPGAFTMLTRVGNRVDVGGTGGTTVLYLNSNYGTPTNTGAIYGQPSIQLIYGCCGQSYGINSVLWATNTTGTSLPSYTSNLDVLPTLAQCGFNQVGFSNVSAVFNAPTFVAPP